MKRNSSNLFFCFLFLGLILVPACNPKPRPARPDPPPTRTETPDPDLPPAPAPTVSLAATPGTIERGEHTSLKWSSKDGTSLVIDNGIGNVRATGEIVISPGESTTYMATVRGRGGEDRASTRVTVLDPPTRDPGVLSSEQELLGGKIQDGTIKLVYFAYDKAQLSATAKETLQHNAIHFRQHPTVKFVVEGHCDERGSEEYNLALGDRRGIAVRDFLIQLGIQRGRMQAVSYGEEQPLDNRKNEKAFARNRRAQFTLTN